MICKMRIDISTTTIAYNDKWFNKNKKQICDDICGKVSHHIRQSNLYTDKGSDVEVIKSNSSNIISVDIKSYLTDTFGYNPPNAEYIYKSISTLLKPYLIEYFHKLFNETKTGVCVYCGGIYEVSKLSFNDIVNKDSVCPTCVQRIKDIEIDEKIREDIRAKNKLNIF